jgi:hypothetical protein
MSTGIEFISYPITDRSVPRSLNDTISLAHEIVIRMDESRDVAVHFRAGIRRSALIAACALIYRGTTAETALDLIAGLPAPEPSKCLIPMRSEIGFSRFARHSGSGDSPTNLIARRLRYEPSNPSTPGFKNSKTAIETFCVVGKKLEYR